MKVIDKRANCNIHFEGLAVGEIVELDGLIYMRINGVNDTEYGGYFNAVCLNDGTLYAVADDETWKPVNVELSIL